MSSAQKGNLSYSNLIDYIRNFANREIIHLGMGYFNFGTNLFDISNSTFEIEFQKYMTNNIQEMIVHIEKLKRINLKYDYTRDIERYQNSIETIKNFKVKTVELKSVNVIELIHNTISPNDDNTKSKFIILSKKIAHEIKTYFKGIKASIFEITESINYDIFENYYGLHVATEKCYLIYFENYCLLVSYGFDD